jgi:hypothetical protein
VYTQPDHEPKIRESFSGVEIKLIYFQLFGSFYDDLPRGRVEWDARLSMSFIASSLASLCE